MSLGGKVEATPTAMRDAGKARIRAIVTKRSPRLAVPVTAVSDLSEDPGSGPGADPRLLAARVLLGLEDDAA